MKLSILICTLPGRHEFLTKMLKQLHEQVTNEVEIVIDDRDRHIPTGTKRNDLISKASGAYVAFIDDDDRISADYVSKILQAIDQGPDVVTFCGDYFADGQFQNNWEIKLGNPYELSPDGIIRRFPNHLCAIKRNLIKDILFPPVYQGEDYTWAKRINDSWILKTEVHIPEKLYHYDYRSRK